MSGGFIFLLFMGMVDGIKEVACILVAGLRGKVNLKDCMIIFTILLSTFIILTDAKNFVFTFPPCYSL